MRRITVPFSDYNRDIQELEELGEEAVRYSIAHGSFFGNREVAKEWLRQKEAARLSATEAETLAIAKETAAAAIRSASAADRSASSAYEQARWAKWAAAIAATAAIISAKNEIIELITKYL
jgi:hypothetical protein